MDAERRAWRIACIGMEELPALAATRLRAAGYARAEAVPALRGSALVTSLKPFDVVHVVYPPPYFKWVPAWRAAGKKVVFHWVGSDLYGLARRPAARALFRAVRGGVALHVADAPWLVADLKALGLAAHLVPTVSEKMAPAPVPLPDTFRLLAYCPDRRRDFYGWPAIKMVAELFPAVGVVAVGGGPEAGAPANVDFRGVVDGAGMDRCYAETSALLRPTATDGLSQMVLEALARGRQVIWTRRFPHCIYAVTPGEVVSAVERLVADCPLNAAGAAYVTDHFTAAAAAAALGRAYDDL